MKGFVQKQIFCWATAIGVVGFNSISLCATSALAESMPSSAQFQSMAQALQAQPEVAQQVSDILAGKTTDTTSQEVDSKQPANTNSSTTVSTSTSTSTSQPSANTSSSQLPTSSAMLPAAPAATDNTAANSNAGMIPTIKGASSAGTNATSGTVNVLDSTGNLNSKWREVVNKQAYQSVVQQAFPLTPDQIKQLRNRMDDTQRAAATPAHYQSPKPTSTSLVLNLSPGATPPVIRLSLGFVSSLVFVDSTGAPWPIEAYDIGNPTAFDIAWNKKNNTLMIQARAAYTYGNMAVKLVQLNTPVMLTLIPGQQVVDYRVDLRVPEQGPNAKPDIVMSGLPEEADERLLNVLDGVPPGNAKRLTLRGADAQAWLVDDTIFLRTRFNVLSPAWLATMSSADGMNAYKMAKTPLILLSRYGKTTQLHVEGY